MIKTLDNNLIEKCNFKLSLREAKASNSEIEMVGEIVLFIYTLQVWNFLTKFTFAFILKKSWSSKVNFGFPLLFVWKYVF